jgi:hypothetical protein
MRNSENKKFEESWHNAFSDAEASPPDNVWTNIDLHLSRVESGDMKRRVVFYQRLAAASVIFAIGLTGLGIWYSTKNKHEQLTEVRSNENTVRQEVPSQERNAERNYSSNQKATVNEGRNSSGTHQDSDDLVTSNRRAAPNRTNNRNDGKGVEKLILQPAASPSDRRGIVDVKHDSISEILMAEHGSDESLKKNGEISLNKSTPEESKVKTEAEILSALALLDPMVAQNETKQKGNTAENWWASLGGTAGSYTPNAGASTGPLYAAGGSSNSAYAAPQSNSSRVGTSFSFGMNFGKKIAPRWMLMSGFNYLTQSTEYNSSVATQSTRNSYSLAADALSLSSATVPTTPYTLSNVSEFISIPFQAGYLFIDHKVGLQLNAGIASDFFMKNTLTDQSGKLLKSTQGPGDNSLYRSVNLTGLMGTELSYKVARHYRVSVAPGLRYSFNSVLKSTAGTTLNPMVWDVGFRFRYMF